MTSRVGLDLRTECFELGADAFVEKPFDPDVLAADVSSRLERAAVRTRLAQRDDLTGLLNLAGLLEALDKLAGRPRALVVAELDGIRAISNRYGWGTAEIIVAEVGKGLLAALPGALLARSAGSEFAAVLPGRGEAEATELAAAMLEAIRNVPVRSPDGETFRLTASAGLRADAGASDTHELVDAVRVLAHAAQSAGGNRVTSAAAPVLVASSAPLVLVAEDDDITAKILMHRLEKEAFEVLRFDNGNDAYRGALKRTPALVILDVKMPGMDGFEVLERLRKTPSYAAVPIMMLTGMGSEADVVRGFELGADDYLLKPFSPTELLARIRRLVHRGRSLS
jgi:diguanylate cyclase (GGDEF)-like protein